MPGRDLTREGNRDEALTALARRRLRGRNLALMGLLGTVVLIFYVLTFVIMGGQGS